MLLVHFPLAIVVGEIAINLNEEDVHSNSICLFLLYLFIFVTVDATLCEKKNQN